MMVLALVGLIFLPCGLVAQILGLGYFEIAQPAVHLQASVGSMVVIFVLTILTTLFCCLVYVVGLRFWRRSRRRNVASAFDSLA